MYLPFDLAIPLLPTYLKDTSPTVQVYIALFILRRRVAELSREQTHRICSLKQINATWDLGLNHGTKKKKGHKVEKLVKFK